MTTDVPEEDLAGKKITPQNKKKKYLLSGKNKYKITKKFQAEFTKNPNFLEDLQNVVEQLKVELTEISSQSNSHK